MTKGEKVALSIPATLGILLIAFTAYVGDLDDVVAITGIVLFFPIMITSIHFMDKLIKRVDKKEAKGDI